jgi:hypothetical protein
LREQKFNDSEKYLFKIAYYNNKEYFLWNNVMEYFYEIMLWNNFIIKIVQS